jgi:uncharacterized protein (TIGR02246 family)
MMKIVGLYCLIFATLATPLIGQSADETAIRALVQKYLDARENQDERAVDSLFTDEADQLVSTGEWRKGRAELTKGTLANSRNSGGKRTITLTSVRFLAPGTAIADGRYELIGLSTGGNRSMWTTFVLTRQSSGWKIAAIRNMLPAPATAPAK